MNRAIRVDTERWVWLIRRRIELLGWQGVVGCALLLFCLFSVPVWLQPAWREARYIKDQAEVLRDSVGQRAGVAHKGAPAVQLAAFYDLFPDTDSVADVLDRIFQAAAENGIVLKQGDYGLVVAEGGVLQRYEITLPVRGRYAQVRDFIGRVLAENKNAALFGVSLMRASAADAGIEAQLRFSLYLRREQ